MSVQKFVNVSGKKGMLLNFALGAFAVLGHAPLYIWPATILAFALLMLRLDATYARPKPIKSGFLTGLIFGFGYFLFGLYWVGSAFIARGPEFIWIMPFAVFLFCIGFALFWGAAGAIYVKLTNGSKSMWRAALFASLLFLAEFTRGHLVGGFPWNLPGYIFAAGKPISQAASLIGVYGLSALVLCVSAMLALTIGMRKIVPLGAGVLVLLGTYTYGSVRLGNATIDKTQYVEGVKLRLVHANIAQRDKFDPAKFVQTVNHYLRLSLSDGFDDVTHIIWPEGAVPGLMLEDENLMRAIDQLMRSGRGEPPVFITQTLRAERRPDLDTPNYYNSAVAISFPKDGSWQASSYYDKQRLVPFGEFMPGGELAKKLGLKSLSTAMRGMSAGQSGEVPNIPNLPPVSIQICYEIIFLGSTPTTLWPSGEKPEWILNLSNDSWYGNSSGPRQHVNQARYRAIEQGLPVVRTTSGGISGVIDAYGRQLTVKNLGEDGVLDSSLPRPLRKTLYSQWMDFVLALLILGVLGLSYMGIRRRLPL